MGNSKLKQRCEEGKISIPEFIDFAAFKAPLRTHCLDKGDYLVAPSITREGLLLEKVVKSITLNLEILKQLKEQ